MRLITFDFRMVGARSGYRSGSERGYTVCALRDRESEKVQILKESIKSKPITATLPYSMLNFCGICSIDSNPNQHSRFL
ncbi:MAG: hypothetical protein HC849_08140 [Oscillatoriales cyanobacterium RU_3_3]|nr:hypothetical protein [Oscillatoriales cyanobacterium RU_3_3]